MQWRTNVNATMDRSNVKDGPAPSEEAAHGRRESPRATTVWLALIVDQDAVSAVWFADGPGYERDKTHHAQPGGSCELSARRIVATPVRSFRCTNHNVGGQIVPSETSHLKSNSSYSQDKWTIEG